MLFDPDAIRPGKPFPLGAHAEREGVNFAVYSETAKGMEVCLFDPSGRRQVHRINITAKTGYVWHVFLEGVKPGQLYGFRARGLYRPHAGKPFNASKLLVDPYARALRGKVDWQAPLLGYIPGQDGLPEKREPRDSAHGVPKSIVMQQDFDWQGDRRLDIPWQDTVIYEVHVKGFTRGHPDVPPELRGTYAGLASEPAIRHLKELGVTAVELLPVHAFADSQTLVKHGLVNYWGYDTLNFFAPEARYASRGDRGDQVTEFKEMVRTLHQNGLEVILDVVYNHTAEGNHLGPTLSLRGLDNTTYYHLDGHDASRNVDYTGTGNSVDATHPEALKLIMNSLRYWVEEMHVDGFRFDLAVTLARDPQAMNRLSPFFDTIHQDPVLSRIKLIAEPWDVGPGGYQVGNFPPLWSEWNDKFRDSVRSFWRGDESHASNLAYRLTGSSDLYNTEGRTPHASINFVVAHDGFTLQDLVSYNEKHNEANGEENRDGTNVNLSWNCGVEGETEVPGIIELRERQKRNLMATLLISQGVPMICGGDELSRTQRGNNNAYCQDNEVSWFDWNLGEREQAFLEFTRRLIRVRQAHPSLRRQHFFQGAPVPGSKLKDVAWYRPDGQEMTHDEWFNAWTRCLGVQLDGDLHEVDAHGRSVQDDVLLVLLNAFADPLDFTLPATKHGDAWHLVFDTASPELDEDATTLSPAAAYRLEGRSLVVLRSRNGAG